MAGAVFALQALTPIVSLAADESDRARQAGEDQWVPSLSIISGFTAQKQSGTADSYWLFGGNPPPTVMQPSAAGDDLMVAPFVGGTLELMSPALPLPSRPRIFVSGEFLPTFASDREVAIVGAPGCIRGPEQDAPCTVDETALRTTTFGEASANGQGQKTTSSMDTLVFGANLGVAFPFELFERQFRIKPSFGWIHYKIKGRGVVVDAECQPASRCTDSEAVVMNLPVFLPGFLRSETTFTAHEARQFNGIGPGLDVEMDVGQFGPVGASLFTGARAYRVLESRQIKFQLTSDPITDAAGTNDVANAQFKVGVNQWMYRAHLGIRFHWLGKPPQQVGE